MAYDVLSLNTSKLGDFIDRIYPIELEIRDTTDTDRSSSYLDLHLEIDSERLNKRNPWFSSFLVSSNPLSRTS
jgi:hypothetical protein